MLLFFLCVRKEVYGQNRLGYHKGRAFEVIKVGAFVSTDFVHKGRASNVLDAYYLARSSVYSELGRNVWLLRRLKAFVIQFLESTINKVW